MTDPLADAAPAAAIRSAVPTFPVPDVAATARGYADERGFAIAGTFPDRQPFAYASAMRGGAEIMLLSIQDYQKPDLRDRPREALWDVYVRMDGVRALYLSLRSRPFLQMPLQHQPYGDWEFEVRDSNGYVLVFGGAE